MDQEYPVGIQLFQDGPRSRGFAVPVTAPVHGRMPEDLSRDRQGVAADGTVLPDIGNRFRFQFRDSGEPFSVRDTAFPVGGEVRPVFSRPDGKLLVGIIDQETVFVEKIVEGFLREAFHTGLKRQHSVLAADIHRIVLDAAGLPDVLICAGFPGETVLPEQPLFQQDELPCLVLCDRLHLNLPFRLSNPVTCFMQLYHVRPGTKSEQNRFKRIRIGFFMIQ